MVGMQFFRYNYSITSNTHMETNSPPAAKSLVPILRWSAPIRVIQERSKHWYMIVGVIVLTATVYGIISGSWAIAIVALLCGAIQVLVHGHVPEPRDIVITEQGIFFNGGFLTFNDLRSFWLIQTPLAVQLHIARKNRGAPITILTGDTDPYLIRETLARFIPEESDKRETILDFFIRICKL